jgi:hypothetical protein
MMCFLGAGYHLHETHWYGARLDLNEAAQWSSRGQEEVFHHVEGALKKDRILYGYLLILKACKGEAFASGGIEHTRRDCW